MSEETKQTFKTPAELGVTQDQFCAIIGVAEKLQSGVIKHYPVENKLDWKDRLQGNKFNMRFWKTQTGCGTVCCIGGWAGLSGIKANEGYYGNSVKKLCFPPMLQREMDKITEAQAATAIMNWATTGDPQWDKILSKGDES